MATYQFLGETNAVPYGAPGYVVLKRFIDLGDLVLNPQKLALASAANTPLSSFAGIVAADVLQIFHVPAGFVVKAAGMYIETADTLQPTGTLTIGDGSSTAGFMAAEALDGAGATQTILTDAYGSSNMESRVYSAADTIDMLGATQTLVDAKFHVYVMGFKGFDLLGADV
jgi:hypothetical protein